MAAGVDAALQELPPDGTCDECEPDEAPEAERVCRECGFCYCRRHADLHGHRFPAHRLVHFLPGAIPACTIGEAQGQAQKDLESPSEDDEHDDESDYETDEGTDRVDSSEDSEEDVEDERESETEEEPQDDEAGQREPRTEFDPEIELEAEIVAQRKCPEHGLDLSTYCQQDQRLICILCPVVGEHQGHQLTTLDEAFEELQSKDSGRLKAAIIELVERLKFKSSDPNVSRDQMKAFIQQEFKKVLKAIDDAEQRALHLVDIQEAMATAHVTEILADIQSHMDRLMTQMAQAKTQLDTSNESAELKAEMVIQFCQDHLLKRLALLHFMLSAPLLKIKAMRKNPVVPVKKRIPEDLSAPVEMLQLPFPLCVYVTVCMQQLVICVKAAQQQRTSGEHISSTAGTDLSGGRPCFASGLYPSHPLVMVGQGLCDPWISQDQIKKILQGIPQGLL